MAVKIRLTRRGRKKLAIYDVVVADARSPRDGRFIEKVGTYNPNTDPATIVMDDEKAFKWVMNGAIPTDTVRAILSYRGVMYRKHLQIGVNKGAITQEEADKKLADWIVAKEAKIQEKVDGIAKSRAADAKQRLDAETKIKEARTEAIKKKSAPPAEEPPVAEEAPTQEVVAEDAPAVEDAPTQEVVAEETPAEEKAVEETDAVTEEPAAAVEEAPAEEEKAPEVKETPAEEAAPVAEEAAIVEDAPAEEAPVAEDTAEETSAEEEAPAEEESKKEDK